MCVSLDEPEPVDSVLSFLSGYDTPEYSWVKATVVSVRLRILFVMLRSTNSEQLVRFILREILDPRDELYQDGHINRVSASTS